MLTGNIVPSDYHEEIQGFYFKVRGQLPLGDDIMWLMSVWDGSKWVFINTPILDEYYSECRLIEMAKKALGRTLNVELEKVFPNINYSDMPGIVYNVGDVLLDIKHNAIGIVLGDISDKEDVLRFDSDGMVSQNGLRFATLEDIVNPAIFCSERVREYLMGKYIK